jgi:hypothetical protein
VWEIHPVMKIEVDPMEVLGNHRGQSQQSRLELGLCLKPWTATGERSRLLMHIGTTVNASLFARMKG